MKKLTCGVMILFLAFCLTACDGTAQTGANKFSAIQGATSEERLAYSECLKNVGVEVADVNSVVHDEMLDDMSGHNEKGYRISTKRANDVIMYINEDKTIGAIRYADKDLYFNGEYLDNIKRWTITTDEFYMYQEKTKEMVEVLLKSPSTAKFPTLTQGWGAKREWGVTIIQGYVDSQNGFGAIVRGNFQVKFDESDTPISLIFDGKEYL